MGERKRSKRVTEATDEVPCRKKADGSNYDARTKLPTHTNSRNACSN